MDLFTNFSKNTAKLLVPLLLFAILLSTFQSCKKKIKSDIGELLFKRTQNKIFKDVTPEGFEAEFKKQLAENKSSLSHANVISAYYEKNEYDPMFITSHLENNDLASLVRYLETSKRHGINPTLFNGMLIDTLLTRFNSKNGVRSLDEAYEDMAQLELYAANSLITYSNAMQYGIINPKNIFARYDMQLVRPDSTSMSKVLDVKNIRAYLDSIQPQSPQYKALQAALSNNTIAPGMSDVETERIIRVNMERLRWKDKPSGGRYVMVNIPDYRLDIIDSGRSVLNMKVCVGEGRNKDNGNTIMKFADSAKIDKPFPRETPLLNSVIYEAQVNPVWNIPASIANKEILVEARKDKYYLSNKNIEVYKNDRKVDDPESIDWNNVKENSNYSFKQKPGDDNSLGKIKFLFKNSSSVYLHDTPAKYAFRKEMRSVSHGCVRLEKPLDFAHALFGDGDKYDTIAKDMTEDNPEPTTIALNKKIPVFITYMTCWEDESGKLQFRPDVYGLDIVLYNTISKYLN